MQTKMKMNQMPKEEAEKFLAEAAVGRLGSIGADGFPYVVPLNFAYANGFIFFHGRNAGEKIENIIRNAKVSFEVDTMHSLRQGDSACSSGTRYTSVIVKGSAGLVEDKAEKASALDYIVTKYTPQHAGAT